MKKRVPVLELRPTQFSIGLTELRAKIAELEKMNKKERRRTVNKTPVPVVVGPGRELYITDHHHFALACCHAGIRSVRIKVLADWSQRKLGFGAFWRRLARENWAYLYDQFGEGPKSPLYLPEDVRGLADDPYRALAWAVRKRGACEDTTEPFAEFKWADYFRRRKLLDRDGRAGFARALKRAVKLARSRSAARLPGYRTPGKQRRAR